MLEPGSQVQNAIYLAGGSEWPVSPEDWEARAREPLEQGPFDYVAGGAGSESTVRANREAFERRRLRPRMLVGTAERDLSVEVLGLRSPAPFLLAPSASSRSSTPRRSSASPAPRRRPASR